MWCVIATEAMLFVCMFGSYYYLGTNKDRWADNVPPSLQYPFILLAILAQQQRGARVGKAAGGAAEIPRGRMALWATVRSGWCFWCCRHSSTWITGRHSTPYSDSYGSIFYVITTLHAAHVIVGLLLLAYVGVLPRYGPTRGSPHRPYATVSLYWHFVDFVWIFIVLLLYVIPAFQGHVHGH